MEVTDWIETRTIFKFISGSHAYGLATNESDIDIRGIAIPPPKYFLGVSEFNQYRGLENEDLVIYGIKKFFKLAIACNPNIIEFLFCDRESIEMTTPAWNNILKYRDDFISTKAKHTFSGYAFDQLGKIKRHKKWLMDPPTKKPEREDFDLPTMQKLNYESLGAYKSLEDDGYKFSKEIMTLFTRENQYQAEKKKWDSYQSWKKNRNLKRMKLESAYGYDTKHGMHLVRLMLMGEEILRDGTVNVRRPDRAFLLSIRNGDWTYDRLIKWADDQDIMLGELYKTSPLPKRPPFQKLENLLVETIEEFNRGR